MAGRLEPRPVLILGAAPRVSVPIARLLRERCGVRVGVAAVGPLEVPLHSSAVAEFFRLPAPPATSAERAEALLDRIIYGEFDTIIPVQDGGLALIAQNYERLSATTLLACPPPHVLERALNKNLTLDIARQCGITVPKTFSFATASQAEWIATDLCFPAIVKPAEARNSGFLKSRYFQSREEFLLWLASHETGKAMLIQEYCPGEGVGVEMLLHKGEPIACFQHRRLKEQPPSGGVAVVAIAEAPDPFLTEASLRLLRAMEWEGVAMVEFRRNPSHGTAMLMEVNGRFWGTTALPLAAGMEFPVYQWQLLHGQRPEVPSSYRVGLVWRWTAGCLERMHSLLLPSHGAPAKRSRWRELALSAFDLRPSFRDAVWSFSDPVPALYEIASTVGKLCINDALAVLRKLFPRLRRDLDNVRKYKGRERSLYLSLRVHNLLSVARERRRRVPPNARSFVFVCHGNIMRSAFCAGLFQREVLAAGEDEFEVASAGLHASPGKPADPRAINAAREFGISLDAHRAQLLTREMVTHADAIFAMDWQNLVELLMRYPNQREKILMMACYAHPSYRRVEIDDPYTGNLEDTVDCYRLLSTCIGNLARSTLSVRKRASGRPACTVESEVQTSE